MAERHRGRDARLARKNLAAVLRGQQTQIEEVAFKAGAPRSPRAPVTPAETSSTSRPGRSDRGAPPRPPAARVPDGSCPSARARPAGCARASRATRSAARTRDRRSLARPSACAGSCGTRRTTCHATSTMSAICRSTVWNAGSAKALSQPALELVARQLHVALSLPYLDHGASLRSDPTLRHGRVRTTAHRFISCFRSRP